MRRPSWLRAPVAHFVAGGAALFCLVHRGAPDAPVVVTAGDVARLKADYVRDTGLDPTAADEVALIDHTVEEELLFREAVERGLDRNDRSVRNWLVQQMRVLSDAAADEDTARLYERARRLGLDRTDLVVRRILVQKMRLLAARTDEQPPDEATVAAYYDANRDDYRPPDRVTFWHAFLATSRHGDATAADATVVLARLRSAPSLPDDATRVGDPFVVPCHVVAQAPAQVEKVFGAAFGAAVAEAPVGTWSGPVPSAYGMHLVWVEARVPGTPPPFTAVRDRVLERWQDERRAARVVALVRALERRYPLQVESAAWRERRAS
jgi:hypothetical protein